MEHMRKQVWAWQCELEDCGKIWIAKGIDPPAQCAKCKKRNWHTKGVSEPTSTGVVRNLDEQLAMLEKPKKIYPKIDIEDFREPVAESPKSLMVDKLKEICAIPEKERISDPVGRIGGFTTPRTEPILSLELCRHREWVDGEKYGCRLTLGHKGKCMLGQKVEE